MIIDLFVPKDTLNCSYNETDDLFEHHDVSSFIKSAEAAYQHFLVVGLVSTNGLAFAAFDSNGEEVSVHFITLDKLFRTA